MLKIKIIAPLVNTFVEKSYQQIYATDVQNMKIYLHQIFLTRVQKDSCSRGGSRTPATSNMEHFVIIVNGWKPLTTFPKSSILDVAVVLDFPMLKDVHLTSVYYIYKLLMLFENFRTLKQKYVNIIFCNQNLLTMFCKIC